MRRQRRKISRREGGRRRGRRKRKKQKDSNQSISDSKRDLNVNQKEKNYKGTGKKKMLEIMLI